MPILERRRRGPLLQDGPVGELRHHDRGPGHVRQRRAAPRREPGGPSGSRRRTRTCRRCCSASMTPSELLGRLGHVLDREVAAEAVTADRHDDRCGAGGAPARRAGAAPHAPAPPAEFTGAGAALTIARRSWRPPSSSSLCSPTTRCSRAPDGVPRLEPAGPDRHALGGPGNFATILRRPASFTVVAGNTVVWVVGSIVPQLVIGFLVALGLRRRFRFRGLYQALIFFPWAISGFLIGILFRWMFNSEFGVVNDLLKKTGAIDEPLPWLADPDTGHGRRDHRQRLVRGDVLRDHDPGGPAVGARRDATRRRPSTARARCARCSR